MLSNFKNYIVFNCLCVVILKIVIILHLAKKGILRDKREFWPVLEQVEKLAADASDITTSVREMPNVK